MRHLSRGYLYCVLFGWFIYLAIACTHTCTLGILEVGIFNPQQISAMQYILYILSWYVYCKWLQVKGQQLLKRLLTGGQVCIIINADIILMQNFAENVFVVKSWCKNKFSLEEAVLDKQFGIPEDFDYL